MTNQVLIARWLTVFPELAELEPETKDTLFDVTQFQRLRRGDVAYYQGQLCRNYLMCIEGQTRVFKTSESGREIMLYQVGAGETCVLTTSCLMAGNPFPAESNVQADVLLAAVPADVFHRLMSSSQKFRNYVLSNYGDLLSSLITLVDEVAFASLDLRLARRLLAEAGDAGVVSKTHQQLALDLGSVREVISRYISEWERVGWVRSSRGSIEVLNRSALASYGAGDNALHSPTLRSGSQA
ncbi:Crp/Fnr family transcriptional regulator [Methyloceanibacter caenitepidi]|uniref:Transcriptional regulator, Crp/Fnr family n=1 Tax=Methyloceanibacter caenitepidi TaxID=1384459 RepID=A0A0A8K4S8_9HYPH|nr:Crp/Fnr family transcriptional regulator [Methyloceanibacter caenitepidi]BAQ17019.1 transcriptional regulator, Crp/Fnr family [Methyloceanibacter caenitepidi]